MTTTPTPTDGGLLDAGLAPVDTPADGLTDTVRARRYTHPALGDRPVVRIVPDALAPAEDAAAEFLGFTTDGVSEPVARTRPRGLGYPEWALVHDPDRRTQALALVRPMERAARMAAARPGRAEEEFASIAADVPLPHLPSYWEQAGRAFLAHGQARTAGVLFGRAREAERVYSLPVDEDTRREAFLEFAFAGALTVKALAGHAAELAGRYEPGRAHAEFRELGLRRSLGGLPPWTGLPKQLRTLARAAGLDPAQEEAAFLRELFDVPAVRSSPEGFWKDVRPTLVAMGRADADVRRALLGLFPSGSARFHDWWLALLDDAGAIDLLADPGEHVPGGAAAWFGRMIAHTRAVPGRLRDLVPRIADRLRAEGDPVRLGADGDRHRARVRVDLLERCLELGVPVRAPGRYTFLDLRADSCREEDGCALAAILADERWEPVLARAVADYGGVYRRTLEDLLPSTCLHPYLDRRLGELVDASAQAGLARFAERLDLLTSETTGAVFAAFPHRRAELEALDPAEVLAATLRAGIVDEFGWPELEEAVEELVGSARGYVTATYSWPVLTLTSPTGGRAVAVGPKGRVAEHDLRLPSDARDPRAVYSEGAFLVSYRLAGDPEEYAYWSSDPETRLAFAARTGAGDAWRREPRSDGVAQLAPDGARMSGDRVLRRGEGPGSGEDHLFHDGATFWRVRDGVSREVDPATGDAGRTSLPAFLEELPVGDGETLVPRASTLAPLADAAPGNPLGSVPGLYGYGVVSLGGPRGGHRVTSADGRVLTVRDGTRFDGGLSSPVALFTAPGGDAHALRRGWGRNRAFLLVTGDGDPVWACDMGTVGGSRARWGTPFLPPPPYWSFMAPRDLRVSRRLRDIGGDEVAPLIEAAEGERREARGSTPATVAATTALLRGEDGTEPDPLLALGVAGLVLAAARLGHDLAAVVEAAEAASAVAGPEAPVGPDSDSLIAGLMHFLNSVRYRRPGDTGSTAAHIDHASRFLSGRTSAAEARTGPEPVVDWPPLLGRVGGLAWYAALPTTPQEEREALAGFLDLWSGTVFADRGPELDTGTLAGRDRPLPCEGAGGRRLPLGLRGALPFGRAGAGVSGHLYVELRADAPLPPDDGFTDHGRHRVDLAWGDGDQLRAFTRALAEHGPLTWDPEAVAVLAERTGLAVPSAALLLAARRPVRGGGLDAHEREVLGLSAAEVAVGTRELGRLAGMTEVLELFRSVLPADPAAVGALWEPGGTAGVAARLADAWTARHGRRVPLPERTLLAYQAARVTRQGGPDDLRSVADPATEEALVEDASSWIESVEETHRTSRVLRHSVGAAQALPSILSSLAHVIAWAHADLPAGDPVREGIPAALEAVRARLAAPELLLHLAQVWRGPAHDRWKESMGDRPYRGRDGASAAPAGADNGLAVALDVTDRLTNVWFRPAALGGDPRSEVLRAHLADTETWRSGPDVLQLVDLLRGPGFTAIAEHVASGGPGAGTWSGDPAASVPELVDEAQSTLGVSRDAARLYLQLLTLLEPTDRRVRSVNGWTPARHRKAQAELVAAEWVMTAKRARSGRSVFLPGTWTDAKAPDLPLETWKLPLYELRPHGPSSVTGPLERFLALRPLPELFTEAWRRVREGDGPGR